MTISILGIDIGKNSCSVVGVDDKGAVIVRRTMRRKTLIEFVSKASSTYRQSRSDAHSIWDGITCQLKAA